MITLFGSSPSTQMRGSCDSRTAYPKADGPSRAEAIFDGLEVYVIVGDALGTIIFDIEETDPVALYDEFGASMRETCREGGGHAPWVETRERAQQFLRDAVRGYSLSSSIGFSGAVWARSFVAHWLVAPSDAA